MKVAQKNPTNPNTRFVHLSHALSMLNMEHSPSGPEPGTPSRLNSPFACFVQHYVRTLLALRLAMLCLVMHCLLCIYCFFPLFFFRRPQDRCWCPCDRLRRWRPFFPFSGASRQAPPWSSRYRPVHSLMLALDFATVIDCSYFDA